ncbi:sporulation and cell division repeat protein [Leptospira yanagawae serovar Saopaulo str. Sao Paulo = ATCC 700523]|uniref:Sporulation and cell division repeat protein n=1 Tax=Leptospira yanagawae serovar Saopaulo str. Sao Paulo = ATCC 700523 TaxID=1249483 RepID=A0A5E8HKU4_9LEPT|nr:SPOR domain-containing protein [Leptospira yanagawae]EOQ90416.1 sporulation and cell division repeat protein [Leptospira yanagawae serovar Saopaulo str. Sao Paulo = ATCC 700523]
MKERVFYVINLDKQRIGVLSLFLFALFFSIFFLGVSVGKGKSEETQNRVNPTLASPETEGRLPSPTADVATKTAEEVPGQSNPSGSQVASSLVQGTKPKDSISSQEIPMADIGNHPYYNETSTAKDEEEERKQQVVDLTKSKEHRTTYVPKEEKLKNITKTQRQGKQKTTAPSISKSVHTTEGKQFTIQLAAFTNRKSAETFLSQLQSDNPGKLGTKAFIMVKNGFFVVQLGKTKDKDSLQKLLSKTVMPKEIKAKAMIIQYQPLS